ncbi:MULTISPECIES: hypothetical protein [unclassified Variovorax]|uniref:hypothetical protein n=1 Tax=unclassified Variovorax TaxID=663243 RepID=UPI00076D2228|nr:MULTISPECIES: hypothetical protein [unclassified Variovorax]KWT64487.1 hypothetical protein APY03_7665 [Variovorax sp. WDL1]PNG56360.1 hypothetical protein CHC07_02777 [Variovorax sp. B4]PNG57784.1 hypothetical protein CHC06_02780 [Variovorax sp. B2]VTV09779.1 hypothetical protein WDL1CHR_00849 [Variovorax sp. WDL1]
MHPHVDIKKIRDRYFNYSVSTGHADERYVRQGLRSIAECLHDAATALGHHFPVAAISYEGRALGCYHVASMEHKTVALAHTLLAKLERFEAAT